jgi:hypothetical protein
MFPFDEEVFEAFFCYLTGVWLVGALILLALIVLAILMLKRWK